MTCKHRKGNRQGTGWSGRADGGAQVTCKGICNMHLTCILHASYMCAQYQRRHGHGAAYGNASKASLVKARHVKERHVLRHVLPKYQTASYQAAHRATGARGQGLVVSYHQVSSHHTSTRQLSSMLCRNWLMMRLSPLSLECLPKAGWQVVQARQGGGVVSQ